MFWDKIFWLWFLLATIFFLYELVSDFSNMNISFAGLLIGIGIIKLAEESRRGKGISRKILEKLRK